MNTQVKKQAEEYAKEVLNIELYKDATSIGIGILYKLLFNTYIQAYQYATQWHSPDEKPERHDKYRSITILFVKDEIYYLGIYDYDAKEWIPEGMAQGFKNIDKWQYLPEVK